VPDAGTGCGAVLGVDLGGTKIAAELLGPDGSVLASATVPTPTDSAGAVVDAVVGVARALADGRRVAGLGVGVAGLVDRDGSRVRFAPNLPLRETPLGQLVSQRTGIPTYVANDANAAAWAEYRFGAGRGAESVAVITVGTGVGGGLVLDGEVVLGAHGLAAEVGHLVLDPAGPECGCGARGCWEVYASGRALAATARTVARGLAERAQDPDWDDEVAGSVLMHKAEEGHPVAVEAFRRTGTHLGRGMAQLAAVLDLPRFVLAGGVAAAGELLRLPAQVALESSLLARSHRPVPEVRLAELGPRAGVIGAADLSRTAIK